MRTKNFLPETAPAKIHEKNNSAMRKSGPPRPRKTDEADRREGKFRSDQDQYSQLRTSGAHSTNTAVISTQGNQPIFRYSFIVKPAAE